MILVSFSSAEDDLTNDVNKYNTFCSQGTENSPFLFFGDTRTIAGKNFPYLKISTWLYIFLNAPILNISGDCLQKSLMSGISQEDFAETNGQKVPPLPIE